jgi:cell wall-associated NlpC family hydrolase
MTATAAGMEGQAVSAPDPHVVSHFIAKQVVKSAKKGAPSEIDLAKAISEIELQTQILGASFLKVTVIDPEWSIMTSGWLDVVDGRVDEIEVEFPEKSGWFWRLCALSGTTDRTQPGLTLTFEDRIVAYLREHWYPPKTAPPGTQTRAQFIRDLVREVGLNGEPKIRFVCPAVNAVQPVEPSKTEKTEQLQTAAAKDASEAKANKAAGINQGSPVTVKGQKLNPQQVVEANTLLSTADSLNAPPAAREALIFAAIAESSIGAAAGAFIPNAVGYYGVLQGSSSTWPDPHDTAGMASSFLLGGKGFQAGGAIALAHSGVTDPVEIAVRVEAPSVWPENAYAGEAGYANFLTEAKAIIAAGGGAGESAASENASDVGQLTRGTVDNPDEDSWECITRLAQQVTWFAFTDGNSLFYIDGPDMVKQRPALHVDVPANKITKANGQVEDGVIQTPLVCEWDNTTFEYRKTHKVKGKVQRRSRASKPSTPAEVRMNIVCGIEEFRAGEVIEFRNSGPINGRWIIANATRHCLKDLHTQLILQPPIEPLPEPKATAKGETTAEAASGSGGATAVVEAAKRALAEKSKYDYVYGGGRQPGADLFGPRPRQMDCSSFTILAYKAAGLPDPSGANYNPIGTTQTLIENMKQTSNPQPGDLCFFGTLAHTIHVTIYIGGGMAISMGGPGDPVEGEAETTGPVVRTTPGVPPVGFLGYWTPK